MMAVASPNRSSEKVTLYFPESLARLSLTEAFAELELHGEFKVFLSFIDPKTDSLVQDHFTFYPNVQIGPRGRCFIAEYNGFTLRIPANMEWWQHNAQAGRCVVRQHTTIFQRGEYVNVEFDLDITTSIRIGC